MLLRKYALKMGIGLLKTKIFFDHEHVSPGTFLDGHLEITGGLVPLKVKRYDIDLVKLMGTEHREEIINSHSVICSYVLSSNEQKKVPFRLEIPEQLESNTLTVASKILLENDQILTSERFLHLPIKE